MKFFSKHAPKKNNKSNTLGIFSGIFGQIFELRGFFLRFLSLGIFLGISGCAPEHIQFSFDPTSPYAEEMYVHVSNALVELACDADADDPSKIGDSDAQATHWRVLVRPEGYHLPDTQNALCVGSTLAGASYRRNVIYVGECVVNGATKYDLGTVIRHELGHALGFEDHLPPGNVMSADVTEGASAVEYTPADLQAIRTECM